MNCPPGQSRCLRHGFIRAGGHKLFFHSSKEVFTIKNIISSTFTDRMRVIRTVYKGVNEEEQVVYDNEPCALSRSAHTHSPTPASADDITPSKNYRLRLYALPEVTFLLGDRVEVTRAGRIFKGLASDSFCYDSHTVCVMEVLEVAE